MVKNEEDFISHFLDHNLPIFDEATIIDNGSTDSTLEILKKYESNCNIIKYNKGYETKGQFCSELMRNSKSDILFPLDADELIVHDDGESNSISKNQSKIRNYLQKLETPEDGAIFKIRKTLQKHPESEGWWGLNPWPKVFFTKNGFVETDQGNHNGKVKSNSDPIVSNLSLIDNRFFSKEYWEKRQIEKLKCRLGEKWNDPNALISYRGADMHSAIEYASYLGIKKCRTCKEIMPSENFGLGRVACKKCIPNVKDKFSEGRGIWCTIKREIHVELSSS